MQVGHVLGSNAVQREFHTNRSKGTLQRKALNYYALEQWCWKLVIGNDVIDETFGHMLFIVKNNHPLWHRAVMLR